MSEHTTGAPPSQQEDLQEYAGGWMTERKNTDAPGFLKLAFAIIGLFGVGYLVVFMNGEINHTERGVLVRQFNQTSKSADGLMYGIAALVFVYVCIVVAFAVRKSTKHDEH
ncbi:MAG TPA: hypothetical protein VMT15_14090 [Bryobacteraceae bacterium]|nr:hypothetical protein [Bryobacteraceae bacterium]